MNNYTQADEQLHRLCQIIAKANRSFVPKKEDDSHTNLGFNADKKEIEGRWISTSSGKIKLALRLTDVCFVWYDEDGESIQTVSTAKKYINEIEKQLAVTINRKGLDVESFKQSLHYEIPEYSFIDQPVTLLSRRALNEWLYWRKLANLASEYVLEKLDQQAEIRIWPHHFDTGIYIEPRANLGIGFGLAMKDAKANAPYFYATCYLKEGEVEFLNLPALSKGKWIANEWEGAILSLEELVVNSMETSLQTVKIFVDESVKWYLSE